MAILLLGGAAVGLLGLSFFDWRMTALFSAGLFGGVLSALIGGSDIITFPILQLVGGLDAFTARASNSTAIMLANPIASAMKIRHDETHTCGRRTSFFSSLGGHWFYLYAVLTSFGGFAGALIFGSFVSNSWFRYLVPLLIGVAAVAIGYSRRLTERLTRLSQSWLTGKYHNRVVCCVLLAAVSVYGGLFGAGAGVMMLAALMVGADGQYAPANRTRNLLTALSTTSTALGYWSQGVVAWQPVIPMMIGAAIGGLLGGRLISAVDDTVLRVWIFRGAVVVTILYALYYWVWMPFGLSRI